MNTQVDKVTCEQVNKKKKKLKYSKTEANKFNQKQTKSKNIHLQRNWQANKSRHKAVNCSRS